MALVTCSRAFRLRRLAQGVVPGLMARHFSCKFPRQTTCDMLMCISSAQARTKSAPRAPASFRASFHKVPLERAGSHKVWVLVPVGRVLPVNFRRILFGFRIIPDIGSTKGSVGSRRPCLKGSILPRCSAQPGAIFTRYTKGVARIFETCSDGLDFCFGFLPSESNRQWPCDHDSLWFYGCSHRWARRWNPPVKMRRKKVMYRMQTHSQSCICHL